MVQLVGMIGSWMFVLLTDRVGRRPLAITGSALLIVWNFLIATIGSRPNPSESDKQTVVASFVLLIWSTKISWATLCCEWIHVSDTALANLLQSSSLQSSVVSGCGRKVSLHAAKMLMTVMMVGVFNDVLVSPCILPC